MSLINLYEHLPKEYQIKRSTYASYDEVRMNIPFRCVVAGPSSAGKTNVSLNIIIKISAWSQIYLCVKCPDEPLYAWFIDTIRKIEKKTKRHIITVVSNLSELPKVDEFSKDEATLIVFDDMVTDTDLKTVKGLKEIWSRGRKQGKGISCFYLTQSFFDVPTFIRKNSDIVILKRIDDLGDLTRILKEMSLGIKVAELTDMYVSAETDDPTKFFMIDKSGDPAYRFRRNYAPIPWQKSLSSIKK